MAAAVRYAEARAGVEYFAVVDETGRFHGYRAFRQAPSASVLKPMLLVAYLNRLSVRGRALTDADRRLLAPMIRWSDNATASRLAVLLGGGPLYRLAKRAGMLQFRFQMPIWGLSQVTARDQAYFFRRLERVTPTRHRVYARRLLASVVPAQRWGIPPVKPAGWKIFFKGGWASGTGRVTHQVALLEKGERRISVAILTQWNPSHAYGTATIRGIAARLFRGVS